LDHQKVEGEESTIFMDCDMDCDMDFDTILEIAVEKEGEEEKETNRRRELLKKTFLDIFNETSGCVSANDQATELAVQRIKEFGKSLKEELLQLLLPSSSQSIAPAGFEVAIDNQQKRGHFRHECVGKRKSGTVNIQGPPSKKSKQTKK
jgi:hypothetical protein